MQTYKAPDNTLHCIDPEFAHLLPPGSVPITDEEAEAMRAANTPTPPIPQSVTMRQARLALLSAGFLDAVDAAIAAMPEGPQRKAAQIEWEYAQTVDRASSFTQQLAAGLGLTDAQMDDLFTQAATL